MIETILIIIFTSILTVMLLGLYFRRTIPLLLNDVSEGVQEYVLGQIQEVFKEPNMQRAMSILGKKSGESRASDALRNKAANQIVETSPVIKMVLDRLDITPLEGLQLLNDPLIGPTIQSFLGGLRKKGPHSPGHGVM